MNEKRVVSILIEKESLITNRFHQAIEEIMRVGCDTERARQEIDALVDSVQYTLEELQRAIDINIDIF